MKNVTRRVYITKRIRTQYLYYKILIGVFIVAVCAFGAVDQYTQRYIASLNPTKVFNHEFIQKAQAKEVSKIEVQTKKAVLAIPEAKESVEAMVDRVVKETNFKWPSYLKRLIKCESGWNPNNTNIHGNNPSTSKDRGLVQINSHWHSEVTDAQAYNPEFSVRFAINMINKGQQGQWACDRIIRGK